MLPVITVRRIAHLDLSRDSFESRHISWGRPGTEPVPMPQPDVLLLEGDEAGHAMLYRYAAGGAFGGDTWHESVEAAERVAAEEYGAASVGAWTPVPEDVPDAHDYAIAQAVPSPAGARPPQVRDPDLEASSPHGRRLHLPLGRAMLAVAVVAATLAAGRFLVESLPHVRECWKRAAAEEGRSQALRREAARYRACVLGVPCSASEYCNNACMPHVDSRRKTQTAASEAARRRAADEHRRAAEDYERAAERHTTKARLFRRAAFDWSQPVPTPAVNDAADEALFDRYRCDVF
jgi:hypothetical protein